LNHGPIGDRVAVGETDLHQARPAADDLADQVIRGLQVGVAGREEGDEGLATLGAQPLEECVDGVHGGNQAWASGASSGSRSRRIRPMTSSNASRAASGVSRVTSQSGKSEQLAR